MVPPPRGEKKKTETEALPGPDARLLLHVTYIRSLLFSGTAVKRVILYTKEKTVTDTLPDPDVPLYIYECTYVASQCRTVFFSWRANNIDRTAQTKRWLGVPLRDQIQACTSGNQKSPPTHIHHVDTEKTKRQKDGQQQQTKNKGHRNNPNTYNIIERIARPHSRHA